MELTMAQATDPRALENLLQIRVQDSMLERAWTLSLSRGILHVAFDGLADLLGPLVMNKLQPMPRVEVEELQAALDMAQDLPRLHALVERLKNVGEVLEVGVTQYGDLHLQVSTTLVSIGSEFRNLRVLGVRVDGNSIDATLNSSERLRDALDKSLASVVKVDVKQFVKSLQCHHTKPDASFCGIAPNDGCLLIMLQYFIPGTRQTDTSISLHYRLPVLLDGAN